jgi:hypothetical protein
MHDALRTWVRRLVPSSVRRARRVVVRLPEVVARTSRFRRERAARLAAGATRTLLAHPFRPRIEDDYTLTLIACRLGLRITTNPGAACTVAMHWHDTTRRPPNPVLQRLAATLPVINLEGNDISKTSVDAAMHAVFGYGLAVDPLRTAGDVLEKDDLNALHDGRILRGPLERRRPGRVYQAVVRGQEAGGFIEELRVPVVGDEVPFVYLKYKPVHAPLELSVRGTIVEPGGVLAPEELAGLVAVSRALGIDFGELDVIRHQADGRLYVLDANNTPAVRFTGVSAADRRATIDRLAEAFERVYLRPGRSAAECLR